MGGEDGMREVEISVCEVEGGGGGGGRSAALTPGLLSCFFKRVSFIEIPVTMVILTLSEMVERGGYTSLDLLDGDCVMRPQVFQYH